MLKTVVGIGMGIVNAKVLDLFLQRDLKTIIQDSDSHSLLEKRLWKETSRSRFLCKVSFQEETASRKRLLNESFKILIPILFLKKYFGKRPLVLCLFARSLFQKRPFRERDYRTILQDSDSHSLLAKRPWKETSCSRSLCKVSFQKETVSWQKL